MGSFGNYLENKILDHIVGKTSYTMPTAYLAVGTGATDAGLTGEPSGSGYARVTTAGADWAAASGGANTNANTLAFPQATGDWGVMTHFAIYDAASGGNMLAWGALTASKTVENKDILRFEAGDLDMTLD